MLRIYIGYDEQETVAWHTLAQSIIDKSSIPVLICPLKLTHLHGFFSRRRENTQSNDFSYSRFLIPYLNNYEGWALYLDCDMMFRVDCAELLEHISDEDEDYAVKLVKHDYTPKKSNKYLGHTQYAYPRKNWSSFVLWNCAHRGNRIVTPEFVETKTGKELHRFSWLQDEQIGTLEPIWNWLVGEYEVEGNDADSIKVAHWTIGGPYFSEYADSDFAGEWQSLHAKINHCNQRNDL